MDSAQNEIKQVSTFTLATAVTILLALTLLLVVNSLAQEMTLHSILVNLAVTLPTSLTAKEVSGQMRMDVLHHLKDMSAILKNASELKMR